MRHVTGLIDLAGFGLIKLLGQHDQHVLLQLVAAARIFNRSATRSEAARCYLIEISMTEKATAGYLEPMFTPLYTTSSSTTGAAPAN